MAESKVQIWVNENDLHCSVCHEALYHAVALPCMHRFCDKCTFFLNKCALCRKDIDFTEKPQPDHFVQSLAREGVKEVPLCGSVPALSYSENLEHRKQCLVCLQSLCSKQEENLRLTKNRCYHLLTDNDEDEDTDSDDGGQVVFRFNQGRANNNGPRPNNTNTNN